MSWTEHYSALDRAVHRIAFSGVGVQKAVADIEDRVFAGRFADVAVDRPVFLAGGLDPGNVGEAVATVRPFGVDVSSGVEEVRGRKDPVRIAAFVQAARRAAEQLSSRTEAHSPTGRIDD